ncbi:MAG: hypothetical protein PHC85_02280 [Candidatus Pacebacteria bacterium]|nr:hypothetical protein [Candidatus Paceibacterota bacterium]
MGKGRKKFIISLALIALLNMALVSAIYFLLSAEYKKKAKVDELKTSILINEKRIENTKRLEDQLAEAKEEKEKIESVFLDKDNLIKFIQELESLAKIANVDMEMKSVEMGFGSVGAKPFFSFTAAGDFSDIYRFLVLIENDPYQIKISRLQLQNLVEGKKWEAGFSVRLLSFK